MANASGECVSVLRDGRCSLSSRLTLLPQGRTPEPSIVSASKARETNCRLSVRSVNDEMLRWRFRTHEAKGADPKTEPQRKGRRPKNRAKANRGQKCVNVVCRARFFRVLPACGCCSAGAWCFWSAVALCFLFFLFRGDDQKTDLFWLAAAGVTFQLPDGRGRRVASEGRRFQEPELSGIPYAVTFVEFLFFLVGLAAALIDALSAQGSHCTGGFARLLRRRIPDVGFARTRYACFLMKTAKLNEFVFAACFSKFLHHFLLLKR